MRVLHVHEYYTGPGGEDTVFHAATSLLRSHGHEVVEYLEFNKKIESLSKVSVALQTFWSSSSYQKMKKTLTETQPDLVHFHNTFPLVSPSAYYACHDLRVPVVQAIYNPRLICPAATFYRNGRLCVDCLGKIPPWPGVVHACYHESRLHTAIVASMVALHYWIGTWSTKIDIFLCATNFYRNLFVKAGFPSGKIAVVPHFTPEVRQQDPSTKAGDYALFLGRLDPEKGIPTLLQAWRHLDFPLRIRGNGTLDETARQFVSQYGIDRIEFVNRLSELELSSLIKNARFLVVPSEGYYETFGMVIIEAYSRGVPVVASNIGVLPELVTDQRTGLLFEAGNPLDLAERARWLWDHPDECARMGHNARKEYEQKYTAEHNYERLMGVYSGLVGGS